MTSKWLVGFLGFFFATATPVLATEREWTLLVYHAYDDPELATALDRDLRSISRSNAVAGSGVQVVVESDAFDPSIPSYRRVLEKPADDSKTPVLRIVENLGETNSGSPQTLENFLRWGMSQYPARNYAVFLSGHGNAWESLMEDAQGKKNPKKSQAISVPEFRALIQRLPSRVQLAVFDACLMSNVEFALEVEGLFDVVVGAESALPDFGISYRNAIQVFVDQVASKSQDSSLVGKALVQMLWNHYQKASMRSEIRRDPEWRAFGASAFEPRLARQAMELLEPLLSDLGPVESRSLKKLSEELVPMEDDFVDLGHFGRILASLRPEWERRWLPQWNKLFENRVVESRSRLNFHLFESLSFSGLLAGMSLMKDSDELLTGVSITWSHSTYFEKKQRRSPEATLYRGLTMTREFPSYWEWIQTK